MYTELKSGEPRGMVGSSKSRGDGIEEGEERREEKRVEREIQ
jgi:hypothetical protein